jgi:hypothetical protein
VLNKNHGIDNKCNFSSEENQIYTEKINNIDTSNIYILEQASVPNLVSGPSLVKFENSSSSPSSSNTKVSSNDQGKTPTVDIRISTKKINVTKKAVEIRKLNGKKSLRIRKSKMRPSNMTKQYSAHNTYMIQAVSNSLLPHSLLIQEKFTKQKSVERGKHFNGIPHRMTHMKSEENIPHSSCNFPKITHL